MKKGLYIGYSTSLSDVVTKDMLAQFGGEVVHEVYSTAAMVYHMEWTSRNLVLPFLDEDEEGMGAEVSVKHMAPSGLTSRITVTAMVAEVKADRVVTEVWIENKTGLIGKGKVKQAILSKEMIEAKIKRSSEH